MHEDTVVAFRQPGSFSDDPLTDVLRAGARQLLGQAIEAEVEAHIAAHADLTDAKGRRRVVRHGYLPEREIQTGIGAVRVKAPRVRDRDPAMTGGRIGFTSSILPPYLRRSQSMEALLPCYPGDVEKSEALGGFTLPEGSLVGYPALKGDKSPIGGPRGVCLRHFPR